MAAVEKHGYPHRWYVSNKNGKLLLVRKSGLIDEFLQELNSIPAWREVIDSLFWHHKELFLTDYEWESTINFEIIGNTTSVCEDQRNFSESYLEGSIEVLERHLSETMMRRKRDMDIEKVLKEALRRLFKLYSPRQVSLYEILCCPTCKGRLVFGAESIDCLRCHISYPVVRGVPVMLMEYSCR